MINIKGPAGLSKRARNRIVIAITNCCRTVGGQGLLLSYTDVHLWGDLIHRDAFPTANTRMPCNQYMLQRYCLSGGPVAQRLRVRAVPPEKFRWLAGARRLFRSTYCDGVRSCMSRSRQHPRRIPVATGMMQSRGHKSKQKHNAGGTKIKGMAVKKRPDV